MGKRRVILVVMDSVGVGYEPDAEEFGDVGANTLKSCTGSKYLDIPFMKDMGIYNIEGNDYEPGVVSPIGAYGRLQEKSKGKDTTIGHWEIAGLISGKPMPTYPDGFPEDLLQEFERLTGRGWLCNKPYSGTDVIRDYGDEHVKTGKLIVYTSADSVFQIAAHEEVVPIEELYRCCEIARKLLVGEHAVGRVIARPFVGDSGNYTRTKNRHDFSLVPRDYTCMDQLVEEGLKTYGVGKIYDIFAGKNIQNTVRISSTIDGMEKTEVFMEEDFEGLIFTNLVDFDMVFGHRRDIDGYAKELTTLDGLVKRLCGKMKPEDILMITADHGCDPGFKGSDHTREYIPVLIYGNDIKPGVDLGTRTSFADIGATVVDIFGLENKTDGVSFWREIKK